MKIVKLDPEEHRIGLSVKQTKEGSSPSPMEDENAKLRLEPFKKPTLGDAFKELDL